MKTSILVIGLSAVMSVGAIADCQENFSIFKQSKGLIIEIAELDQNGKRIEGREIETMMVESIEGIGGTYKLSAVISELNQETNEAIYTKKYKSNSTLSLIALKGNNCGYSFTRDDISSAIGNPRTLISIEGKDQEIGRKYQFSSTQEDALPSREIKIIDILN